MGMTSFILLAGVLQSIFISLGVGASTLAILNFFAAIKDGTIDASERHLMGIVYIVLRVAMVGILFTTVYLLAPTITTDVTSLSVVAIAQLTIIAVLFINAALMTARLMPSKYGPGIQAGSWYTLGAIAALQLQGIIAYSYVSFLTGFTAMMLLAVVLVLIAMNWMKRQKSK